MPTGLSTPIKSRILWIVILLSLATACGAYSVSRGSDVNWDLRNYHLYNPFAAYHDRYMVDVAPAQLQSYLNPILDFPFYAAVAVFNDWPRAIAFFMGAVQGFNLLAVTLLGWHCLGTIGVLSGWGRSALTLVALAIGATGAGTTPLIGSTTGDLLAAVPILIGLYFLLHAVDEAAVSRRTAWRDLMLAGGIAGLGVGSKLTMAPYGVAMVAALFVLPPRLVIRGLTRFLAAGIFGGILTGGYHHLRMLWLYGNPLLPMMNTVFQSPYWELSSVRDTRFLPKTMVDVLFYPWEWSVNSQYSIVSELPFCDIRIALAMSLGILILAKWGIWRYAGQWITTAMPSSIRAVVIFGLVAYFIWLSLFGIYRYLLPLEMLSGLFVVLALGALFARPAIWTLVAVAAAVACMVTTVPLEWGHRPFGNRYVEVSAPTLPSDTLVVLVGDEPVSYLIPFMSPDIVWVGLLNNFLSPDQQNLLIRRERDLLSSHKDNLMVLKTGTAPEVVSEVLAAFGLAAEEGNCKSISTNLNDQPYQLCQVVKLLPDAEAR
jgi:hypothetical protein